MLRSFSSSGFGLWLLLTGFVSSHWSASPAWGEGDAEPVARKLLATTLTVRSAPSAPADRPALAGKTKSPAGNSGQARNSSGVDAAVKDAVKEVELREEAVAESRLNRHDGYPTPTEAGKLAPRQRNVGKGGAADDAPAARAYRFAESTPSEPTQNVESSRRSNVRRTTDAKGTELRATDKATAAAAATKPVDATAGVAAAPTAPSASQASAAPAASPTNVTVSSGVSVGDRLVVTFAQVASPRSATPQFRVTLPDGQQSSADLRVVDHYSGLSLVELESGDMSALQCSDKSPKVGDTVYTAAASGIDPPIISRGIVSGLERALSGTGLPPLLLCDVRTTETSSGAPLVNESGELVGVIIAAGATNQMANWAYAVPAQFVTRLMSAHKPGELVVLERRRATVGLTMGQGEKDGTVEVEQVTPKGPADQAGIQKGDRIVEADGRKIRSAYQAVERILSRQPGDTVEFLVERDGEQKNLAVTLGGAAEPSGPAGGAQSYYLPQVKVEKIGGNFKVERGIDLLQQQVNAPAPAAANRPEAAREAAANGRVDEVRALQEEIFKCAKSISELQAELSDRETKLADNEKQIEVLRQELRELRRKVSQASKSANSKPTEPKPAETTPAESK